MYVTLGQTKHFMIYIFSMLYMLLLNIDIAASAFRSSSRCHLNNAIKCHFCMPRYLHTYCTTSCRSHNTINSPISLSSSMSPPPPPLYQIYLAWIYDGIKYAYKYTNVFLRCNSRAVVVGLAPKRSTFTADPINRTYKQFYPETHAMQHADINSKKAFAINSHADDISFCWVCVWIAAAFHHTMY